MRQDSDNLAMVALTGMATVVIAIGVLVTEGLGISHLREDLSSTSLASRTLPAEEFMPLDEEASLKLPSSRPVKSFSFEMQQTSI